MLEVYKITNKINNKIYIGVSNDVPRRWRNHIEAASNIKDHHYNYPLMQAFREFGVNNFTFEIIDSAKTSKELIQKEHDYIIEYNCVFPNGYNQTAKTDSPMLDPNIANKMKQTKRKKYGKKVAEINDNNEIINIFNSIVEAGEQTGLDRYKISAVCNGKRLTTGKRKFRFINENNEIIEPIINTETSETRITKASKPVGQYTYNGQLIAIYPSVAIASKETNCCDSGISAVCRGKRFSCGGFIWKYQK